MTLLVLCCYSLDVVPCCVEELEYIHPLIHTLTHTHTLTFLAYRFYDLHVYVISVVNITEFKCLV